MSGYQKTFLFIDESGDPSFYASGNKCIVGTEGFKPLLLLGLVKLENKKAIRDAILCFMEELRSDPLYNSLPCMIGSNKWYLHASYDNLEIRVKFAEFLRKLEGFDFNCVIGRKRLDIFHNKHNRNESEFYFDLLSHLIKGVLTDENTFYQIMLSSKRQSTRQKLKEAVEKAIRIDNAQRDEPLKIKYNCEIVSSKDNPELSIVDYLLWSIQRYLLMGEKRFFTALESKCNLITDLYGEDGINSIHYSSVNKLDPGKMEQFRVDGYQ
jgi:hypothetical protein